MTTFMSFYSQKATFPVDDKGQPVEPNEALETQRKELEKFEKEVDKTSEEFNVKQEVAARLKDARVIAAQQKRPLSEVVDELNKTKEVEKKIEEQVKKDMAEKSKGDKSEKMTPEKKQALKEQLPI